MNPHDYFIFVVPPAALLLDLAFADPAWPPHPVRLIGWLLNRLEGLARKIGPNSRIPGALCLAVMALAVGAAVYWLTHLTLFGPILALYFGFAGLALGSLLREGKIVLFHLLEGDLEKAREKLGGLVSRDVRGLNKRGLQRGLAESLSENLNDAFVAPFFYLILAGPVGLWVYKTVSTMDSMWGYKTKEWRDLGWASARADDVLAFIPARITALVMIVVGFALGLNAKAALGRVRADAKKCESPNAGLPMAAAAWLLEAKMGGEASYFGEVKKKPVLGPPGKAWGHAKLKKLMRLVLFSGLASALVLYACGAAGYYWRS
ncbi:MAG: adenosylcobinamide-phosphate synthase CbiB [Thermodesulfobacteriota bacterium]|nr:adenosylcobinamide-phosphate synthase CbiB [Thermodesulfobacteriota bacterium]